MCVCVCVWGGGGGFLLYCFDTSILVTDLKNFLKVPLAPMYTNFIQKCIQTNLAPMYTKRIMF